MATTANVVDDKGGNATTTTALQSISHKSKRFRQFLHPNGRRIHIAQTPEEQARLKKELHPLEDFDIYIHGTEEHVRFMLDVEVPPFDKSTSSKWFGNSIPTKKRVKIF